ncbi:MAG TPA: hypothetical protein VIR63_01085, partial [Pontiella sp.]
LLKEQLGERLNTILYPRSHHVWYAPINYRDKAFLENIGLSHIHALPNAVTAHPSSQDSVYTEKKETKTILYPARAIRRKNIGEFLLWSLLSPKNYTFQSTLAPQNETWKGCYNEWVTFAEELNLPVEFDVGRKYDFGDLVRNADALISTSIAEGFGLAFLEPWLENKLLIGRKLPEITTDFEKEGIDLSTLYTSLPVPIEWVGEDQFSSALESAIHSTYDAYSKPWKSLYLQEAKQALIKDGKVDFGILNEELQRKVIRLIAEHPRKRKNLPEWVLPDNPELIKNNRKVINKQYSIETYGELLLTIYQKLKSTEPNTITSADAPALLEQFLQPQRFNLLRA